ncbi:TPA: hypothetical protein RQM97_000358 [Aeromonas dhakensis]|nr:hypothetical protein [Aeromonas dhakensis]
MITLTIPSKIHDYSVSIFEHSSYIEELLKIEGSIFVIDRVVYNLYSYLFSSLPNDKIFLIDAVEEKKNIDSVIQLYNFTLQFNERKHLTLVSFGGGIVQDITGFVASTLYRGIRWIYFPTTLLAQADSCVGSKTSLNFESFKNTIGTFYPPHSVNICTEFLNTLSADAICSGIGEIIKFMILDDQCEASIYDIKNIVSNIKNRKIYLAALEHTHRIKKSYITQDEFDIGKRNLFNYGHCFGHALEYSSDYKISHGVAVTIGMLFANIISLSRNLISIQCFNDLKNELLLPNIIVSTLDRRYFSDMKLLSAMRKDKKRVGNKLSIIMLTSDKFTAAKFDDLSDDEFLFALSKLIAIFEID